MRTSRRAGFTLAEVLVATAVAAVVAALCGAALWQGFRVQARLAANRPAEDDLARLALVEALRADVASAAPLALVPFEGDARGFSAARLHAAAGAAPAAPAAVVRFSWTPAPDGRSMLRREAPAAGDIAADAEALALARPLPYLAPDGAPRFSYAALVPDPADTNKPPSLAWSDEWTDPDAAPALVRASFGATAMDFDVARAVPRRETDEPGQKNP